MKEHSQAQMGSGEGTEAEQKAPQPCQCLSVGFRREDWGTPVVRERFMRLLWLRVTFLLISVRVKYTIRCELGGGAECAATLSMKAGLARFNRVPLMEYSYPEEVRLTGPCNGLAVDGETRFLYLAAFEGDRRGDIRTEVNLLFDLADCGQVTPPPTWWMRLQIYRSTLDEDGSDYDGDQKNNGVDSYPWDPTN